MTAFVDTNVLAYALDAADPAKQAAARAAVSRRPRPRTSPQVLRELYVVARSKLGLAAADAEAVVRSLEPTVGCVEDAGLVLAAIGAAQRWKISLWDALIVEAARRCDATTVLSEDLQHGMDFDGVVVEDPFAG